MRELGISLDDVIDNDNVIEHIHNFFVDKTRTLKLILFNKNINDLNVSLFIKDNEKFLSAIGSQVTRDFSVPVYFYIGETQIPNYSMWYKGTIDKGLFHFEQLLNTQDERRKHIK